MVESGTGKVRREGISMSAAKEFTAGQAKTVVIVGTLEPLFEGFPCIPCSGLAKFNKGHVSFKRTKHSA